MTQAYPLAWPIGVPRTEPGRYAPTALKTQLPAALKNVQNSLQRFGTTTGKNITGIVISSNCSLGVSNPRDPGVAVWFVWDGRERCIAVDRYARLENNLQAIHLILEARITEARHGGLRIVQQTFSGFVALPSPEKIGEQTCWQVLGVSPSAGAAQIRDAHKRLARQLHPDAGGTVDEMSDLNRARDAALAIVGA